MNRGHSGDALAFAFLIVSGLAALVVMASLPIRLELLAVVASLLVSAIGVVLLLLLVYRNYR